MANRGGCGPEVERVGLLLDAQVSRGTALVLPHVFRPGFQDEGLDVPARLGGIGKDAPPNCSVPPSYGLKEVHGLKEFAFPGGVNHVLHLNQHRPVTGIERGWNGRFGPMHGSREIRCLEPAQGVAQRDSERGDQPGRRYEQRATRADVQRHFTPQPAAQGESGLERKYVKTVPARAPIRAAPVVRSH